MRCIVVYLTYRTLTLFCDVGWNQKIGGRESNYGSRIDYILVTPGLMPWIKHGDIEPTIKGSDHCPVYVDLHDSITLPSGEILTLREAMRMPPLTADNAAPSAEGTVEGEVEGREPPRIAARFWEELKGKQMVLSNFFGKKGDDPAPDPSQKSKSKPRVMSRVAVASTSGANEAAPAPSASQPTAVGGTSVLSGAFDALEAHLPSAPAGEPRSSVVQPPTSHILADDVPPASQSVGVSISTSTSAPSSQPQPSSSSMNRPKTPPTSTQTHPPAPTQITATRPSCPPSPSKLSRPGSPAKKHSARQPADSSSRGTKRSMAAESFPSTSNKKAKTTKETAKGKGKVKGKGKGAQLEGQATLSKFFVKPPSSTPLPSSSQPTSSQSEAQGSGPSGSQPVPPPVQLPPSPEPQTLLLPSSQPQPPPSSQPEPDPDVIEIDSTDDENDKPTVTNNNNRVRRQLAPDPSIEILDGPPMPPPSTMRKRRRVVADPSIEIIESPPPPPPELLPKLEPEPQITPAFNALGLEEGAVEAKAEPEVIASDDADVEIPPLSQAEHVSLPPTPSSPLSLRQPGSSQPNGNGNDGESSKDAWSTLFKPLKPPKCIVHGEPTKELRVNKPGPNKGKTFFICSRYVLSLLLFSTLFLPSHPFYAVWPHTDECKLAD